MTTPSIGSTHLFITRVERLVVLSFVFAIAASVASESYAFDTVINSPPDDISGLVEIGNSTQLNLFDGGVIDAPFSIGPYYGSTDAELNVYGGTVHGALEVHEGGAINISGGVIDTVFSVNGAVNVSGGVILGELLGSWSSEIDITGGIVGGPLIGGFVRGNLTLSGGTFGSGSSLGDNATIVGGEFRFGGREWSNEWISLTRGFSGTLTGTLADGTAFICNGLIGDTLSNVHLSTVPLPPPDTTPVTIDGSSPLATKGLRAGQSMAVLAGGRLATNFQAVDARLDNRGGAIGDGLEISGSEFTMDSGSVGVGFAAYAGSSIEISGGVVGGDLRCFQGSTVRLSGGAFGSFHPFYDSQVELVGGEFSVNGEPYSEGSVVLGPNDFLTGTLGDGSSFVFRPDGLGNNEISFSSPVTLTTVPLPTIDSTPILVDDAKPYTRKSLRAGQSLVLLEGGELPDDFRVVDATVTVEGGEIGDRFEIAEGVLNLRGGFLGAETRSHGSSTVNVSGDVVADEVTLLDQGIINVRGGAIGRLTVASGSHCNLSSGEIGRLFVMSNSELNVVATDFQLDGVSIADLTPGQPIVIEERNVSLSGVFADGSTFSFDLNNGGSTTDLFWPDAVVRITLLSGLAGDFNNDGLVDAADYALWRSSVGTPEGTLLNDLDEGPIGGSQYETWREHYGDSTPQLGSPRTTAPEPTGHFLAFAGIFLLASLQRIKLTGW